MTTISGIPIYISVPLLISCCLCFWRIIRGPYSADRIVALDMFGILVISFCVFMAHYTDTPYLMDIAISWAILGFIGTLALAKYLEGKNLDD
ncbi:MAG: cation:proton antiporter [Candidatus Saganbacteria bacterium]|nr:cation:proton antiporter [Candidatus Saganbacteria bacterium]